jgi:hypothetical protein
MYQHTWALCHLLGLHSSTTDYVLLMEYHDDVVVLDSSRAPRAADLFQIKTLSDKSWKTKALLAIPKPAIPKSRKGTGDRESVEVSKAQSILGKLLDHCSRFWLIRDGDRNAARMRDRLPFAHSAA